MNPSSNEAIDVRGVLLYADGSAAGSVPVEIVAGDRVARVWTAADGAFELASVAADAEVSLRSVDGLMLGLDATADGASTVVLGVGGRLSVAFVVGPPKVMALVVTPPEPSAAATRVIAALDLLGVHGDGELLTTLPPAAVAALRSAAIEVLVLHHDANAYAAQTGTMSDAQRIAFIDDRVAKARVALAKVQ